MYRGFAPDCGHNSVMISSAVRDPKQQSQIPEYRRSGVGIQRRGEIVGDARRPARYGYGMSKPKMHNPLAEQISQAAFQAPSLIDEVANWLMTQALEETDFESMYEGCCERLLAAGVPLWRGLISFRVLHPLYSSMDMTWMRGRGVELENREHGEGAVRLTRTGLS